MMKLTETLSLVIFNLLALSHNAFAQKIIENLSCDFNDYSLCDWSFGGEAHFEAIFNYTNYDYDNAQDLILLLRPGEEHKKDHFVTFSLQSPAFDSVGDYELSFNVNINFVGNIFVVVAQSDSGKSTESQILKITSNRKQKWDLYSIKLPRNSRISVMLEIKFDPDQIDFEHDYIAVNNLNIIDKKPPSNKCDYKCESNEQCLPSDAICDTRSDCPQGEDERLHCDKLPSGSYCNFQSNFCHWFNEDAANSSGQWMHIGSSAAADGYLAVAFKGVHRFATLTYLKSVVFEPIPLYHSMASSKYHKSCRARFSYLFGTSSSDLSLELEPQLDHEKQPNTIVWRKFNRQKAFGTWENVSISLPLNVHHKYRLIFGAGLGLKTFSAFNEKISVAIDNFSLSKECFGIDVPESEPRVPAFIPSLIRGKPFTIPQNKSIKSYTFTSCGAVGRIGPTYSQCESFYLNSSTRAAVFENTNDLSLNGSQMWTVPKSAYYTIFALGASGGKGLHNETGGRGSLVRAAFWFQEGDTIFISVGQAGADACSEQTEHFDACKSDVHLANPTATPPKGFVKSRSDVGGGGGGATYVFKMNPHQKMKYVPLLIAGGGGGGAGKLNADIKYKKQMHGRGLDVYNLGSAGNGDGAGGGWRKESTANNQTGQSLLSGAHGGLPCRRLAKWQVNGGFGGGGGACSHGGAGGGFHGGNINKVSEAGDGGTSYADFELSHLQLYSDFDFEPSLALTGRSGGHRASAGLVVIVPQIDGCCNGGRYPCLVTGQSLNGSLMRQCVCGDNKFMEDLCVYERPFYLTILWITLCFMVLMFIVIFVTYIYIQKRKLRHKISRNESNDLHLLSNSSSLSAADLQLSRLRHNILTEYNPNYEFGGSTCTLQDLREISREKLTLVKALGNGAFGEVYQGCLHNHPGEVTDELPVAIKTLPEYNTSKQAEMDFVMEALIMSKFKHRNIVRFIGICFERMPRFIVLELLPGGDLKSFLRENRATIDSPTTLVMGDLLVMALDIACGCLYLEEHHFIHRDIAARNCLLTSKVKMPSSLNSSYTPSGTLDINQFKNGFNNSGLIAKIADFGMARDIYRADYYRKGGKAMLPVKWMPPEAFLDGVFTSKTDIWSFGVLLWEVMSMGYMPYPGRGNQEVMHLVTNNQRLEPPNSSTPPQVYAIMTQCWNGTPEFRPSFGTIIERLGYCLQDPDVINVPLPIFHRSASMEKDMTAAMRPPQDSTDYLMPNNPGSQTNSNYSMATEKTELLSQDTCSTLSCVPDDKLLEIDDHHQLQHPNNAVKLWNDEAVIAQQTGMMQPAGPGTSYNAAVNLGSAYPSIKVPFTTGVVLNPMNLSYQQQQQQQPCVRYVNVSAFGVTRAAQAPVNHTQQVNSEQPPSAEAPPAPINC